MTTRIALFRGINVGGKNLLPMKELTALLEELGCRAVKTYIQSGNVVFRHAGKDASRLAREIQSAIRGAFGFEPRVLLLTTAQLRKTMAANPFPEAEADPSRLHVVFLESVPKRPDRKRLEVLKAKSERFSLRKDALYLHAPDGIGRSKLFAGAEKALGVEGTTRNWRTVARLREMADSVE